MGHVKIFYDWEFLEDGRTIEPISLGMVREDGKELYAVYQNITTQPMYGRICRHDWLMRNVVPHLPLAINTEARPPRNRYAGSFTLNRNDPVVMTKPLIKNAVRKFLVMAQPVELWGYYAAYDHVLLAQLFGPMTDCPSSMPMVTYDIVQLCHSLGRSEAGLPAPPEKAHNALEDARWSRDAWEALSGRSGPSWAP